VELRGSGGGKKNAYRVPEKEASLSLGKQKSRNFGSGGRINKEGRKKGSHALQRKRNKKKKLELDLDSLGGGKSIDVLMQGAHAAGVLGVGRGA